MERPVRKRRQPYATLWCPSLYLAEQGLLVLNEMFALTLPTDL